MAAIRIVTRVRRALSARALELYGRRLTARYGTSYDPILTVPLVVLSAMGLVPAAVMLTSGKRWTAWVAIGYALITLAGDAPHQLPALAHPSASPSHRVGGTVLIAAGLAALATAARAGLVR